MDWSPMGWDVSVGGQLQSCVYDTQDYDNYACSDFVAFTASDDEGKRRTTSRNFDPRLVLNFPRGENV